jgi:anti-anti-sigma factor
VLGKSWVSRTTNHSGETTKDNTPLGTVVNVFEIEREGNTLIVIPRVNISELAFEQIQAELDDIVDSFADPSTKNIILDFQHTDYYGSTALGWFVKLWKEVARRSGRMIFCNVSNHEKEILKLTNLDHLWPICASREEALQMV